MKPIGEKFDISAVTCFTHGVYEAVSFEGREPRCPHCMEDAVARLNDEQRAERQKRRAEQLAKNADEAVPVRYKAATLDDFATKVTSPILKWFEGCQREPGGLILAGPVGTGKTHLACALTRKLVTADVGGKYVSQANYLRAIRQTWGDHKRDESSVIEDFIRPRVLVLDDIGAARGNENDTLRLGELIADRYDALKPTVYVTNLTPDVLKATVGDRSYDRMRDGATMIVLNGDSRRKPA
jgi:DNA replication protein DnaC